MKDDPTFAGTMFVGYMFLAMGVSALVMVIEGVAQWLS